MNFVLSKSEIRLKISLKKGSKLNKMVLHNSNSITKLSAANAVYCCPPSAFLQ
jgi:hypothetical protein